ncbi:PREDICTED: transmembrane 9 superfamily member 1-like isoform X3 [Brassica oleracea var. oleracea]|uniref:transmembrane 9 superfamily member 1-like isoform X3 n=1 Tax=Brassica oleracea var. oleracea TaxID=109376 RepID=UPI0006A731D9|nr:PREDICTED: transmembrane 9 superfamily member 1-like isoform X3 [Brassica oleracea var. oleracea]
MPSSSAVLLLLVSLLATALASDSDHKYQADEKVTLWVNKVGPYNNPQETYNYYSLPFCRPSQNDVHKWGGLGEVLGGNELIDSEIPIKFLKNVDRNVICHLELDEAKVNHFKDAIESSYWFEFFMDDLPLWGFVGELHPDKNSENGKQVLYTHKNIIVKYNKDQIIHVNLTQDNPTPLEAGRTVDLTYSVQWIPTDVTFARRFDIHWFSIFNSFMMVIFLTGLVSMILMRTLRNDYAKYAREDDDLESLERDVNEESGWKLVHGDVFRPPWSLVLLSAVVGTGAQLALLVLLVILIAIVGTLYVGRGAIVTTFIVCYALTSFVSGYVSGGMYSRSGGKHWIKCMVLTASLFPFLCFGIGFLLNTIAIFYGSLAAIPFGTMVVMFVIWGFISFPLALLGTVVGRNWSGAPNNPCRVKTIPRPIPEKKWYLTPSVVSLMGGLLPFGSIFIEMYFVFTSFWNYKGLTGVLCVWIHAAGFCDSGDSDGLCDNCGNLFPAERRELSLAMDFVFLSCFNGCLCLLILHLLLLRKDQDVWILPDKLLLWIHNDVLSWPWNPLRSCWILGIKSVCKENLQKHQVRLDE